MSKTTTQLDEEEIRAHMSKARNPSLPGVMAEDVKARGVRWLWPEHLPLGMFCGLEGDPAEGKTLAAIDIAARITRGGEFPDGSKAVAGNVLIISGEDDEAVTLRPRLEAAGADLSRVRLWTDDLPVLPKDLPELLHAIETDQARLVILDPIDCFYDDKIDPNVNPSVRRALRPLRDSARDLCCTIWGVRHLNKDVKVGKAIYRGSGSIGFAAQARAVFLVNRTPEDADLHAFARVKGNLSKRPPTLAYRIVETTVTADDGSAIKVPKIEWADGPIEETADDLLREPEPGKRGPKPVKLDLAKAFLRGILADGNEHPSKQVIAAAKDIDISYDRLSAAANELGVKRRKDGFTGDWQWSLRPPENPPSSAAAPKDPQNSQSSGKFGNLGVFLGNPQSSGKPFSPNGLSGLQDSQSPEDREFRDPPENSSSAVGQVPNAERGTTSESSGENLVNGGIPFIITNAMRAQLRARGYSDEQMSKLTPADAHRILRSRSGDEQADRAHPEGPRSTKFEGTDSAKTPGASAARNNDARTNQAPAQQPFRHGPHTRKF